MFNPESLHIVSYKLHKLNIDNILDSEEVENFYFDVDNKIDLGFNDKHSLVKSMLEINVRKLSGTDDILQAQSNIVIEYVFLVDNFADLHKTDKNGVIAVDKMLTNNITAIAYSTTRGLLLDKFKDTALEEFILPVIDVSKDISNNSQS